MYHTISVSKATKTENWGDKMFQLKWIWENMKGFQKRYVLCLCSTVVLAMMQLINPIITQKIVDDVVMEIPNHMDNIRPLISTLTALVLVMILFTATRTGLGYLSLTSYERCAQKFLYRVRKVCFGNLQVQDSGFYDQHRTGDLLTRMTGDMDMIRHVIAYVIRMFIECFSLFAVTTVYMLTKDVLFTLSLLVVTPFIFIATRVFAKTVQPRWANLREKLSSLNSNAQENISGNRVVKAFAREEYEKEKFEAKNLEYKEANLKASLTWIHFFPIIDGLSQAMNVAVLLVGGIFMIKGRISSGTFMAFNSLSWTLSNPMRNLGMLLNDMQRFFASADKIIELYYVKPNIKSPENAVVPKEPLKGEIHFEDVSLNLHGTTVLDHVTLDIKPGETVAIMGATGSGKTTLINCINRFRDVTSGAVTVDGVNVKDYDLKALRKNIGVAHQDVFLFSDTIDGNIAYGDLNLSDEDAHYYAKLAAADEFIETMDDGYDTLVGERGVGLSGGQKQRIALARALAVKPSILILDDTTSAVDMETEKYIQHSLKNLDFPCTKIIIAQRISTTKSADKILIMDRGRIIEEGTHSELVKRGGYYSEVYALQNGLSMEEVLGVQGGAVNG